MAKVESKEIIVEKIYKLELSQEEYDIILGSVGKSSLYDVNIHCDENGYCYPKPETPHNLYMKLKESR